MNGITEALVDHALGRRWETLSDEARAKARIFFEDTLCVGVAGCRAPYADAVLEAAQRWSGSGTARILGRPGVRLTAPYAAFVNAFQIHAQEYDCVHEGAVAHPLATVLASLLSAADARAVTGEDFLTALTAGVDVVAALGIAVTTPLKFFRPATAGIFGSVAALARLHRLNRDGAKNAFGHALAFAGGTMQAHVEGKPGLALQVAAAARSAVEAIDLAMLGVPAPASPIEGPFGYARMFEDGFDADRLVAGLARERVCELSWKPFPTGRAAQGAIVALRTMIRDHGLTAANLRSWTYAAPPLIARLVGRPAVTGMEPPYARLCLAYLAAVTLQKGSVGLGDFERVALDDVATLGLAKRFIVETDANLDQSAFVPALAHAELTDGSRLSIPVIRQFGSPDWPLTLAEHEAKAEGCLIFGGLADQVVPLRCALAAIESTLDVRQAITPAFGERHPLCG